MQYGFTDRYTRIFNSIFPMVQISVSKTKNSVVYLFNIISHKNTGLNSDELFFNITSNHTELFCLYLWDCLIYILFSTFQNKYKIPKWQSKSIKTQNMDWSPIHVSNFCLARNLATGYLLFQFYIIFDPWFETISENSEKFKKKIYYYLIISIKLILRLIPNWITVLTVTDWPKKIGGLETINSRPRFTFSVQTHDQLKWQKKQSSKTIIENP